MYGGFEQVGPIGQKIPGEDEQTVTDSGDIVLRSGNQIVVFYGSASCINRRYLLLFLESYDIFEQTIKPN